MIITTRMRDGASSGRVIGVVVMLVVVVK